MPDFEDMSVVEPSLAGEQSAMDMSVSLLDSTVTGAAKESADSELRFVMEKMLEKNWPPRKKITLDTAIYQILLFFSH